MERHVQITIRSLDALHMSMMLTALRVRVMITFQGVDDVYKHFCIPKFNSI